MTIQNNQVEKLYLLEPSNFILFQKKQFMCIRFTQKKNSIILIFLILSSVHLNAQTHRYQEP